MKKPTFLKFNDEKDEKNEERMGWIETQDKNKIATYIMKKYNITLPIRIKDTPKIIAFSDEIIPAGIGRKFVRYMILSDSASAK